MCALASHRLPHPADHFSNLLSRRQPQPPNASPISPTPTKLPWSTLPSAPYPSSIRYPINGPLRLTCPYECTFLALPNPSSSQRPRRRDLAVPALMRPLPPVQAPCHLPAGDVRRKRRCRTDCLRRQHLHALPLRRATWAVAVREWRVLGTVRSIGRLAAAGGDWGEA